MATSRKHFWLGLFVLMGLLLLLTLAVTLGANDLYRRKVIMETYLNESVQGLDIGSKVRYRGVLVGEVSRITFTSAKYELDRPANLRRNYVLVEAALYPELLGGLKAQTENIEQEVQRGLRVRLSSQGVTGLSYLEVDYVDGRANPPVDIDWVPEHIYVPSTRSTVSRIVANAEDFLNKLNRLELPQLIQNLNTLSNTANRRLEELPMAQLSHDSLATLKELRTTNQKLQGLLDDPAWKTIPADSARTVRDASATMQSTRQLLESGEIQSAVQDFRLSMQQVKRSAFKLEQTVGRVDNMVDQQQETLGQFTSNLRRASDNLIDLSEDLRASPSQLLWSAPPPALTPPPRAPAPKTAQGEP